MIELNPIGIIHTPFTKPEGMPIQPAGATGIRGTIELLEEYRAGLKDLDDFSHIILSLLFSTGAADSSSMLSLSWIQNREGYLPPARPGVQIRSGFPLSNWIISKMGFCISKTLTFWMVHHCLISSPTCRNLTVQQTFGLDGLSKQGKTYQAINRMIDSNKTANKAFQRTPKRGSAEP